MQKIGNPVPSFYDITGRLGDGGKLYYGVKDGDPLVSPISTFWDVALTLPAAQPIRTVGGRIVNGTTPASVYVAENDYSYLAHDSLDNLVDYEPSLFAPGASFQPLDADLTTISGQTNAAYGLALLEATGVDPFVTEGGNETLTNKTLTTPAINGGSLNAASVVTDTGTIAVNSVGFRGMPTSGQTQGALINLATTDNGKRVPNTTGGWNIPVNTFPVGYTCILYNDSGATQIVSSSSDTLRLAGTTSTGTRTVAVRGHCTLVKENATEWTASSNVT